MRRIVKQGPSNLFWDRKWAVKMIGVNGALSARAIDHYIQARMADKLFGEAFVDPGEGVKSETIDHACILTTNQHAFLLSGSNLIICHLNTMTLVRMDETTTHLVQKAAHKLLESLTITPAIQLSPSWQPYNPRSPPYDPYPQWDMNCNPYPPHHIPAPTPVATPVIATPPQAPPTSPRPRRMTPSPTRRGSPAVLREFNTAWALNLAVVVVAVVVAGGCFTIQQKMLDRLNSNDKQTGQLRTEMDDANYRLHAGDIQFGQIWHALTGLRTQVDSNKKQIGHVAEDVAVIAQQGQYVAENVAAIAQQGQYHAVSQKYIQNQVLSKGAKNTPYSDHSSAVVVHNPLGPRVEKVQKIDPRIVAVLEEFYKKHDAETRVSVEVGNGQSVEVGNGKSVPNTDSGAKPGPSNVKPQQEGEGFWSIVVMLGVKAIGFILFCMICFFCVAQQCAAYAD
jgi:hypothetical protein